MAVLSPSQVGEKFIEVGKAKASLPIYKMILLGVFAGIFIALAGVGATTASMAIKNASVKKLLSGLIFPAGLIMVVIAGSELFTGNNLMIVSLLDKKITVTQMLKNWFFVYLGNLIGSLLIVVIILFSTAEAQPSVFVTAAISSAEAKAGMDFLTAFLKGIPCNILVCIAVWGAMAADSVEGKILMIFFPIMLFIVCGFEHCVANMYYLPMGLTYVLKYDLTSSLTVGGSLLNLLAVTLGNIVGGAGIVGCGYYFAYVKKSQK